MPKNVDGASIEPVSAETILKNFARACFPSSPSDPRYIGLKIPEDKQRGMRTVWMSRYEQLDEVLQSICEYTDIGYKVYIDFDNKDLSTYIFLKTTPFYIKYSIQFFASVVEKETMMVNIKNNVSVTVMIGAINIFRFFPKN